LQAVLPEILPDLLKSVSDDKKIDAARVKV